MPCAVYGSEHSTSRGPSARGRQGIHLLMQTRALAIVSFLSSLFFGCTGKPDGVEAVRPFDLQRYKGEWFEIMRLDHSFERGLTNVTATYTLRADGSVGVLNKGFNRKNCRWKEADGRAVSKALPIPPSSPSRSSGLLPAGITSSLSISRIIAGQ
jgi:hypothetical protein